MNTAPPTEPLHRLRENATSPHLSQKLEDGGASRLQRVLQLPSARVLVLVPTVSLPFFLFVLFYLKFGVQF